VSPFVKRFRAELLDVRVYETVALMARDATDDAVAAINTAVDARGEANIMLATGNSQLAFLQQLVARRDVAWSRVTAFHMDEYAGLPPTHPASFQRYMRERVAAHLPLRMFHYLDGTGDPEVEARRYALLLAEHPLDLCCAGIGENGHLAFNDPPVADFSDPHAVKVIALDAASRRQQVGEGHFASIDEVPTRAITVTIPALLAAARLLVVVPEARKAEPVRRALGDPVSTECPATILRLQPQATLYLDADSAASVS
jgi:glucosamine-6-phosphate deaminase